VGKTGDVGATVAYDPDDTAIEAGVQIAAGTVLVKKASSSVRRLTSQSVAQSVQPQ